VKNSYLGIVPITKKQRSVFTQSLECYLSLNVKGMKFDVGDLKLRLRLIIIVIKFKDLNFGFSSSISFRIL